MEAVREGEKNGRDGWREKEEGRRKEKREVSKRNLAGR